MLRAATWLQAIVTAAAKDNLMPHLELCILFALKKPDSMAAHAVYQAMCQAVLAGMLSPKTAPVVVLTDLQERWQLLWVDDAEVMAGVCKTRGEAMPVTKPVLCVESQQKAFKRLALPSACCGPLPSHFGLVAGDRAYV